MVSPVCWALPLARSPVSVSYTHLDVYKRQPKSRSSIAATAGGGWTVGDCRAVPVASCRQTSSKCPAPSTLTPLTSSASPALSQGTNRMRPASRQARVTGSTPRIPRNSPPSASSPKNSYWANRSRLIWPEAARMPSAIGRSKRPPSLGRSAGARLMAVSYTHLDVYKRQPQ